MNIFTKKKSDQTEDQTAEKTEEKNYSPINIRTRTSPLKNHSEYWTNLEQVQIPFAKRVLGEKPSESDKGVQEKQTNQESGCCMPILSLGIFGLFGLL